jgi:hypothetical protein
VDDSDRTEFWKQFEVALAATKEALRQAEIQTEKRFQNINELRARIDDRVGGLPTEVRSGDTLARITREFVTDPDYEVADFEARVWEALHEPARIDAIRAVDVGAVAAAAQVVEEGASRANARAELFVRVLVAIATLFAMIAVVLIHSL